MKAIRTKWAVGLVVAVLVLAFGGMALAQTPAGTVISNQAVAKYTDTGNQSREAVSNVVYVTVQQVAGVQVAPTVAQTVQVVANQVVQYSFKLTNTGNGPDTFALAIEKAGSSDPGQVTLFHDVNGNGIIDAGDIELTTVGPVAAGSSIDIIARFRVPSNAQANENIKLKLNATSQLLAVVNKESAEITFTVVTEGAITITLEATSNDQSDRTVVAPDGIITYTSLLTNQGMLAVDGAAFCLNIPPQTEYKPGSLRVNGNPQDDPDNTWCITLPILNGGQAHQVVYEVKVKNAAQVGFVDNQVSAKVGVNQPVYSNVARTRVHLVPKVKLARTGVPADYIQDTTEIGQSYSFVYKVTNEGNGADTIFLDATVDTGWSVTLYASDAVTPLATSGGKYTVGVLAPQGPPVTFIAKVTVPTSAPTDTATHTLTVKASTQGGATTHPGGNETAELRNVLGAGVTVTAPIIALKGDPGTVVEYTVKVKNEGPAADLFHLSTVLTMDDNTYPMSGFTVELFDSNGNPITNISVPRFDQAEIKVRATIPAGKRPVDPEININVKATSQNNSSKFKHVDLKLGVNQVYSVSIAPNRSGSANRGGFTTYDLTVTNLGNAPQDIKLTTALVGVGTARLDYIFIHIVGGGVIGADHTLSLAPNASDTVRVRVDVPTTVAVGTVETIRVTAAVVGQPDVTSQVTVTTTVTGGELQLSKAVDEPEAKPGDFRTYTIVARNISVGTLKDVVITEKIPQHTTFISTAVDPETMGAVEVYYSTDAGTTWVAALPDPELDLSTITDIKWKLVDTLAANGKIVVTLVVKIK